MKSTFFGYYPPSSSEYERLWNEGLIVLDTNVLLNLYRLPTVARDELVSVLESLKERLWIPHQVALEFHRKRLTVIAAERKSMEDALTSASGLVTDLRRKVDGLQIEKRGLGIEPESLISDLTKANNQLVEAIQTAHTSQLDISASDPIRERLDDLLEGRVGIGPATQAELEALCADGEDRYRENIPPGFMDADKDKNPKEAVFIFDRIKYQRKYGDLILWRQIIAHARDHGIKTVLLVTADRKEDWWWREQGKTIGPHPELVREIRREGQVDLFWMYSSVQFVEHANTYSSAKVSTESVAEIQNVMLSSLLRSNMFRQEQLDTLKSSSAFRLNRAALRVNYQTERPERRIAELAVGDWLAQSGHAVEFNQDGFPDFIVRNGECKDGYEIKFVRNVTRALISAITVNALFQGYIETNEGRLGTFSLVVLISQDEFVELLDADGGTSLMRRSRTLLRKYRVRAIIVGAVVDETFDVLFTAESDATDQLADYDNE